MSSRCGNKKTGPDRIVVGITGASGTPYAVRLVALLADAGREVDVVVTRAGRQVMIDEAGLGGSADAPNWSSLWPDEVRDRIAVRPAENLVAPPASGSYPVAATAVVPCSMNTLSALACGRAENLVQRAGAVALKEGRPLVLVPREMPLTVFDLENMRRLAQAGAVILPAMPGFYHRPRTIEDLVDSVVARVLDRLGVAHDMDVAWPGAT